MEHKLLSIVVPVYNGEDHLETGIQSLLQQEYRPIEIIIVNDGSTDRTATIIEKFSEKHDFIKALHKQNGGAGSARNAGMRACSGEFVTFFDADDQIDRETYFGAIACLSNPRVDLVQYPTHRFFNTNNNIIHAPKKNNPKTEGALYKLFMQEIISSSVCDKIYRKSILQGLSFDETTLYEDMLFISQLMNNIKVISFSSKGKYLYSYRESSVTNVKASFKRTYDYTQVRMSILQQSVRYSNLFLYRTRYLANTFRNSEVLFHDQFSRQEQEKLETIINNHKPKFLSIILNALFFKIGLKRLIILLLLRFRSPLAVFNYLGKKRQ